MEQLGELHRFRRGLEALRADVHFDRSVPALYGPFLAVRNALSAACYGASYGCSRECQEISTIHHGHLVLP